MPSLSLLVIVIILISKICLAKISIQKTDQNGFIYTLVLPYYSPNLSEISEIEQRNRQQLNQQPNLSSILLISQKNNFLFKICNSEFEKQFLQVKRKLLFWDLNLVSQKSCFNISNKSYIMTSLALKDLNNIYDSAEDSVASIFHLKSLNYVYSFMGAIALSSLFDSKKRIRILISTGILTYILVKIYLSIRDINLMSQKQSNLKNGTNQPVSISGIVIPPSMESQFSFADMIENAGFSDEVVILDVDFLRFLRLLPNALISFEKNNLIFSYTVKKKSQNHSIDRVEARNKNER